MQILNPCKTEKTSIFYTVFVILKKWVWSSEFYECTPNILKILASSTGLNPHGTQNCGTLNMMFTLLVKSLCLFMKLKLLCASKLLPPSSSL